MLSKLKRATRKYRCSWANGCRKQVKYVYGPKRWYFCKLHAQKFEEANKGRPKRKLRYFKQKRKTVTARVLKLREKATWAERIFKDNLKIACPVRFQFQRGFIKGGYYAIVDFYIPSRKICIEVDGKYHEEPEQQRKDKHRDKWLIEKRGMKKVIRLTNEQAKRITVDEIIDLIECPRNSV